MIIHHARESRPLGQSQARRRKQLQQIAAFDQILGQDRLDVHSPSVLRGKSESPLKFGVDLHHASGVIKNGQGHRNFAHDCFVETFQPVNFALRCVSITDLPPATDLLHRDQREHLGVVMAHAHAIRSAMAKRVQGSGLRSLGGNDHNHRRAGRGPTFKESRYGGRIATIQDHEVHFEAPGQLDVLRDVRGGKDFHLSANLAEGQSGIHPGEVLVPRILVPTALSHGGKIRLFGSRDLKNCDPGKGRTRLDWMCSHQVRKSIPMWGD